MFADACEEANAFMRPVVVSIRMFDGTVRSGASAFVVVNPEGWIVTAAHTLELFAKFQVDQQKIKDHDDAINMVGQQSLNSDQRRKALRRLRPDPTWLRNVSIWWAQNNVTIAELFLYPQADVLFARLEGFDMSQISRFPRFKNPDHMRPGTSLVRIGYPFHEVPVTWDDQAGFQLGSTMFPMFAIEGIHARNMTITDANLDFPVLFLETSSPGLKGQSGGPILDRDGAVHAIQSQTKHYPLGFEPEIEVDGKKVREHQFLNVGWGVHNLTVKAVAEKHGIALSWVD